MCMLITKWSMERGCSTYTSIILSGIKKNTMTIHSTFSIPVTLTVDYIDSNQTCAYIFELVLHNYWTKFEEDASTYTCRGDPKVHACVYAQAHPSLLLASVWLTRQSLRSSVKSQLIIGVELLWVNTSSCYSDTMSLVRYFCGANHWQLTSYTQWRWWHSVA